MSERCERCERCSFFSIKKITLTINLESCDSQPPFPLAHLEIVSHCAVSCLYPKVVLISNCISDCGQTKQCTKEWRITNRCLHWGHVVPMVSAELLLCGIRSFKCQKTAIALFKKRKRNKLNSVSKGTLHLSAKFLYVMCTRKIS